MSLPCDATGLSFVYYNITYDMTFLGNFLSQLCIINKANRCITVFFSRDHNVKLPKIVKNSFIVLLSLPFSFFFAKLLQICQIHFPSFSKKIEGVLLLTFINLLLDCWVRSMISLKIRLVSSQKYIEYYLRTEQKDDMYRAERAESETGKSWSIREHDNNLCAVYSTIDWHSVT